MDYITNISVVAGLLVAISVLIKQGYSLWKWRCDRIAEQVRKEEEERERLKPKYSSRGTFSAAEAATWR